MTIGIPYANYQQRGFSLIELLVTLVIFSIGLLIPWARVRMVRYWLSCFTMTAAPDQLERFVAAERSRVEATGAELGEALDLDLGI